MDEMQVIDRRRYPFTMIDNVIMEDLDLDIYTLATYNALCYHANNNTCFPSLKTIAKFARCSKRKVQDCISILIAKKIIQKKKRSKGKESISNLYYIYGGMAYGAMGIAHHAIGIAHGANEQDLLNNTNLKNNKRKKITKDKPSQMTNFKQRDYDEDDLESLYTNL